MTHVMRILFFVIFSCCIGSINFCVESGPKYILIGTRADSLPYKLVYYICDSNKFLSEDLKTASTVIKNSNKHREDLGLAILYLLDAVVSKPQASKVIRAKKNFKAGKPTVDDFIVLYSHIKTSVSDIRCLEKSRDASYTYSKLGQAVRAIGKDAEWSEEKIMQEIDYVVQQVTNYIECNEAIAKDSLKHIANELRKKFNYQVDADDI